MKTNDCPIPAPAEMDVAGPARSTMSRTESLLPRAAGQPGTDVTIFVACYNEERNIVASLDEAASALRKSGRSWEIIVVDDASTDGSAALVKQYMCDHPDYPVLLVVREKNQGLAQNYIEAAFLGRGTYFKLVCGDNVEDREQIASVLRHIGEADMVLPYHEHTRNRTLFRRTVARVFTILVNLISGYRLKYYNGCGVHLRYNVMRWNGNYRGFDFQADLVVRLLEQGKSYVEVPIVCGERPFGSSKAFTMRNMLSAVQFYLDLCIRRFLR